MICKSCGGTLRVQDDYLVCNFCGGVEIPEPDAQGVRVLDEAPRENCPVCSVPMVQGSIAGVDILYCRRCLGMLIDMDGFLGAIQELHAKYGTSPRRPKPLDERALERRLLCPKCSQVMDTHPYGGPGNIVIDTCEQCQLNWLDYSEIERVARAADSE